VADSFKCPSGTNENVAKLVCEPIKAPSGPATTTTTTPTGGGTTTTGNPTTTTSKPSTPTTTTTTATTTSTKHVINKAGPTGAGGGGGATHAVTGATPHSATGQPTSTFLTYANVLKKITIKYPSTWTKTESVGNPNIPVLFTAPATITSTPSTTAAAPKTSFVINIIPSAANLDGYTQQQINALTQSQAVKYTITNTNAKELTPPTGITVFREISYDGMKNFVSNKNIPTQVPLKGAAIFFVNGGTGYSLLYLAKQTEYAQNLPMIQQMVNSFQIGNGATTASSGVGGGPVQNLGNASPR
jgi:hypothetical protein